MLLFSRWFFLLSLWHGLRQVLLACFGPRQLRPLAFDSFFQPLVFVGQVIESLDMARGDAVQRVVSEGGNIAHEVPISFQQLLISLQQLIESLGRVRGVLRVRPAAAKSRHRNQSPN